MGVFSELFTFEFMSTAQVQQYHSVLPGANCCTQPSHSIQAARLQTMFLMKLEEAMHAAVGYCLSRRCELRC